MKSLICITLLLFFAGCIPTPTKSTEEKSASATAQISPSMQAIMDSAPIARSIVAEKNLLIETNPSMSLATKRALENAVVDIDKKSAARAYEEFHFAETMVNCVLTDSVANCTK